MSFRAIDETGTEHVDNIEERVRQNENARLKFTDANAAEALGLRVGSDLTGTPVTAGVDPYQFSVGSQHWYITNQHIVPQYGLDPNTTIPFDEPPVRGIVPGQRYYQLHWTFLFSFAFQNYVVNPGEARIEAAIRLNSGNTQIGDGNVSPVWARTFEAPTIATFVIADRVQMFSNPVIFPALATYDFTVAIGVNNVPAPFNSNLPLGVLESAFSIYDVGRVNL